MTLTQILVFTLAGLLFAWLLPPRWKPAALLAASLVAVYWLQPATPIRHLDFWLPTLSVGLAAFTWAITRPRNAAGKIAAGKNTDGKNLPGKAPDSAAVSPSRRADLTGVWIVLAVILAIGLTRYLEPICCLTPTRPPDLLRISLALGLGGVVVAGLRRGEDRLRFLVPAALLLLVGLFIVLKADALARLASSLLRALNGQQASLASPLDVRWLGFSYLAFRLIHTLRDYQSGKLPAYSLPEFLTYALFYPALTAGPIDRSQHFVGELRRLGPVPSADGIERILLGAFKKFVLADSLALVALNAQNAVQVQSAAWTWVLLYAYTLRIFFDFAGYTDVAIGLARLVGISLPENFDRPYLKTNLTAFWNSWHMTLTQWIRAYFFNPLARALRTGRVQLPAWLMVLIAQLATMVVIGLWHGLTWNFVAWGAWHGLGMFVHNRWAERMRVRAAAAARPAFAGRPGAAPIAASSTREQALRLLGWAVTFHYVALGWVWFALPSPGLALDVYRKLLGGG